MARMIPEKINTGNLAERQVFRRLRDETPDNWVVFHSLHVLQEDRGAPGEDSPYARELDFVILIHSMVLYLEVKAGGKYYVKDRQWYNRRSEEVKDPVEQARSGAFTLLNDAAASVDISRLKFRYGVLLTNTKWPSEDERRLNKAGDIIQPYQDEGATWIENGVPRKPPGCLLIDGNTYQSEDEKAFFGALARYARVSGLTKRERRQLENPNFLGEVEMQKNDLQRFVAPSFTLRFVKVNRNVLRRANADLLELTEQQYNILNFAETNPRMMTEGAAGTGKTLLALELARRRHAKGERVALLCNTSNMVQWLRLQGLPKEVLVATLDPGSLTNIYFSNCPQLWDKYFQKIKRVYSEFPQNRKFKASNLGDPILRSRMDLEEKAYSSIVDEMVEDYGIHKQRPIDYLIVDEAHIACNESNIKAMNAILEGGITAGKWTIFGDFTSQNIELFSVGRDFRQELKRLYPHESVYGILTTNCRNALPIAEMTDYFVAEGTYDLDATFQVPGPEIKISYLKSKEEIPSAIDREVSALLKQKISPSQLVLLAMADLRDLTEIGALGTVLQFGGLKLRDVSDNYSSLSKSHLNFSDFQDFQGLESDVVILLSGIGELSEYFMNTLYTAISRAKVQLIILAHESQRELLVAALAHRVDRQ